MDNSKRHIPALRHLLCQKRFRTHPRKLIGELSVRRISQRSLRDDYLRCVVWVVQRLNVHGRVVWS